MGRPAFGSQHAAARGRGDRATRRRHRQLRRSGSRALAQQRPGQAHRLLPDVLLLRRTAVSWSSTSPPGCSPSAPRRRDAMRRAQEMLVRVGAERVRSARVSRARWCGGRARGDRQRAGHLAGVARDRRADQWRRSARARSAPDAAALDRERRHSRADEHRRSPGLVGRGPRAVDRQRRTAWRGRAVTTRRSSRCGARIGVRTSAEPGARRR